MHYMIVDQYILFVKGKTPQRRLLLSSPFYLRSARAMQNPSAMLDIVMIVPVGPAVSEVALLPLPELLLVLLLFFVLVTTAPPDPVPGSGAPVVSTLRVHRATGLMRLQTPERVVAAALFT